MNTFSAKAQLVVLEPIPTSLVQPDVPVAGPYWITGATPPYEPRDASAVVEGVEVAAAGLDAAVAVVDDVDAASVGVADDELWQNAVTSGAA